MAKEMGVFKFLFICMGVIALAILFMFWPVLFNSPEHQASVAIDNAVDSCDMRNYYYIPRLEKAQALIGKLPYDKQAKYEKELSQKLAAKGCSSLKSDQQRFQETMGSGFTGESSEPQSDQ